MEKKSFLLPPALTSFVHHIHLNDAGWKDKTIQRFILAIIWLSTRNLSLEEIRAELDPYSVTLDVESVKAQLEVLTTEKVLIPLQENKFKLSEQSRSVIERDLSKAEENEKNAKAKFLKIMEAHCPEVSQEDMWKSFNTQVLNPLIQDMGVRIYEIISGSVEPWDATQRINDFFQSCPEEVRPLFKDAIVSFLDPKDPDIRFYVLRLLNAYFFREATNLRDETLQTLSSKLGEKPEFNIFLDTNFVLSILDLHENPFNTAVKSFVSLIETISDKVTVKLFVLPITIAETRRVLNWHKYSLKDWRLFPNLAEAALKSDLSSIDRKFAEVSKATGHPIDPEEYFNPYIVGLTSRLKERGVELYNEKTDRYKEKEEVNDDIAEQLKIEEELAEKSTRYRPKKYEVIEHDIILWHFTKDKRSTTVESPLDVKYWVGSLDTRYRRFDAAKRRTSYFDIPICVLPAGYIQMLQFWVPRSAKFEEAMIDSFRPFFLPEFDIEAESVARKILSVLSRYEDVGDLPKESIVGIIMNGALRKRLSVEADPAKQAKLVKDAIIRENKRLHEQRIKIEKNLAAELKAKDSVLRRLKRVNGTQKQLYERELAVKSKELVELQQRIKKLEDKEEERERGEVRKKARRKFLGVSMILPIALIFLLLVGISFILYPFLGFVPWGVELIVGLIGLLIAFARAHRKGAKDCYVKEWAFFLSLDKVRKYIIIGLVIGIVGSLIASLLLGDMIRLFSLVIPTS